MTECKGINGQHFHLPGCPETCQKSRLAQNTFDNKVKVLAQKLAANDDPDTYGRYILVRKGGTFSMRIWDRTGGRRLGAWYTAEATKVIRLLPEEDDGDWTPEEIAYAHNNGIVRDSDDLDNGPMTEKAKAIRPPANVSANPAGDPRRINKVGVDP